MKKFYLEQIKKYCREAFLKTRDEMCITQEEMAHLLMMSTRAYVSLESGKSCCSLCTFIRFLKCCPIDSDSFICGLLEIISDDSSLNAA